MRREIGIKPRTAIREANPRVLELIRRFASRIAVSWLFLNRKDHPENREMYVTASGPGAAIRGRDSIQRQQSATAFSGRISRQRQRRAQRSVIPEGAIPLPLNLTSAACRCVLPLPLSPSDRPLDAKANRAYIPKRSPRLPPLTLLRPAARRQSGGQGATMSRVARPHRGQRSARSQGASLSADTRFGSTAARCGREGGLSTFNFGLSTGLGGGTCNILRNESTNGPIC
jgi:hypothetical protein